MADADSLMSLLDEMLQDAPEPSGSYWDTTREAAPITIDALNELMRRCWEDPPRICGVTHPHVVHPRAEGWTLCANCFGPVFVVDVDGQKMIDLRGGA